MNYDDAKYIDNVITNASLFPFNQTTGVLNLLNGCSLGTSQTTRQGSQITMTDLELFANIMKAPTQTGESAVRIIVALDHQSNAAAPSATDILEIDAIHSPYVEDSRFDILYDAAFAFGSIENTTIIFDECVPVGADTQFRTSTNFGDIRDIITNSLYLLTYSTANLQTAGPSGSMYARLFFEE